jgi:hypothetical protein
VLRVIECVVRDLTKVKSTKKRDRIIKEVLGIIDRVLFQSGQSRDLQRQTLIGYLDQIILFDLQSLFEMSLSSETYTIIEKALKLFGQLLIIDDD